MSCNVTVLCPYCLDKGLLSKAVELSSGSSVRVLIPETDIQAATICGATHIHTISTIPANERSMSLWLSSKILAWNSKIILAPATIQMRNIMPMLAWHLKAGLTADCTSLTIEGTTLLQTRPAFGNSLVATIKSLSPIQMATVRPGTFPVTCNPSEAPVIIHEDIPDDNIVAITAHLPYTEKLPLSQAQIIVAGGLGIGSKEGFTKLESLANQIGGSIAASRNAVDAGFAPYRMQIGMTGVTVCPKLYIAVGISGAVQHLAGISGSDKIIAINSDPKAPIFDYADYGIVADWESVIDKLLEELS